MARTVSTCFCVFFYMSAMKIAIADIDVGLLFVFLSVNNIIKNGWRLINSL